MNLFKAFKFQTHGSYYHDKKKYKLKMFFLVHRTDPILGEDVIERFAREESSRSLLFTRAKIPQHTPVAGGNLSYNEL